MTTEPGTAGALASDLCAWIDRLFPDADRGERLKRALDERFREDTRAVTEEWCREVEAVAHHVSRHFALEYVADGSLVPDSEPPGWPPQDPCEVRLRAGSVSEVTRCHDGVGVLALDGLDGVDIAAPYLQAAFALLRGTRGVVLDLRRNGGGDPGTVTLVLTGCSAASRPTSPTWSTATVRANGGRPGGSRIWLRHGRRRSAC